VEVVYGTQTGLSICDERVQDFTCWYHIHAPLNALKRRCGISGTFDTSTYVHLKREHGEEQTGPGRVSDSGEIGSCDDIDARDVDKCIAFSLAWLPETRTQAWNPYLFTPPY
jgi:hypothetical protein